MNEKEQLNINNLSLEIQLETIKKDGFLIQYIDDPSLEIQLEAVKQDRYAIEYIKNPFLEVQFEAIKYNGYIIRYIKNPSLEVQLKAIKYDIWVIEYIDNPCLEIKQYVANNLDFNKLITLHEITIDNIQEKIKDVITKEIYYKVPKDFPWLPEIKNKFKDTDRFKRFNL